MIQGLIDFALKNRAMMLAASIVLQTAAPAPAFAERMRELMRRTGGLPPGGSSPGAPPGAPPPGATA